MDSVRAKCGQERHSFVAVRIIPMVEIILDLKFFLAAQNQLKE